MPSLDGQAGNAIVLRDSPVGGCAAATGCGTLQGDLSWRPMLVVAMIAAQAGQ